MPFDTNQFVHDLDYKLNVFALSEATDLCEKFVTVLRQSNESIPLERAEKALKLLRRKRMFDVTQKVADTLLQTGRITYNIQRQYAQALIDSGPRIFCQSCFQLFFALISHLHQV